MNIALVNPVPEKIIELHGTDRPHIGLGYLSSYLRKNIPDINLTVIDGKCEQLSRIELIDRIIAFKPDIVGLTSFTMEIYDTAYIAKMIKSNNKNTRICIGGVHVIGVEEQVLEEFTDFDFAVIGEGEVVLKNLLNAISEDKSPENIKGLIYRDNNGKARKNIPDDLVYDIDSLPIPDWSFVPRGKSYPIMSARGCPFRCIFCMRPYGNSPRVRSPERVVDEIEFVHSTYDAKKFIFYDESLGAMRSNFNEILDLIIVRGLNRKISFEGHTHVNIVKPELFQKMKEAGFTNIGFGAESGDDEILKNIGKSINTEKIYKAVRWAKKAGLRTSAYFILGMPNETYKSAFKTISFAKKLNTDTISIGIMIPFPKTKVYEMVHNGDNGYIKPATVIRWDEFNKQTSNPLRYKKVNHRILRLIQILGYLYHTIGNLRIKSLFVRLLDNRRQILNMFQNILTKD